jgi:hypothetical protein
MRGGGEEFAELGVGVRVVKGFDAEVYEKMKVG